MSNRRPFGKASLLCNQHTSKRWGPGWITMSSLVQKDCHPFGMAHFENLLLAYWCPDQSSWGQSFSWVKWTKTGFCLMLIFCSFIQDGLRCDWGMERGAWYLKCSMVIPLFSSLYSLSPLPTLVSISFHPDYSGCYWKISTRKAKCSTSHRQKTRSARSIMWCPNCFKNISGTDEDFM